MCDDKRQESANSVHEGMRVFLIACTRLAISHLNRSVHTSSRSQIVTTGRAKSILQTCLAKNGMPNMASLFTWLTTKSSSSFTSLTRIGICTTPQNRSLVPSAIYPCVSHSICWFWMCPGKRSETRLLTKLVLQPVSTKYSIICPAAFPCFAVSSSVCVGSHLAESFLKDES